MTFISRQTIAISLAAAASLTALTDQAYGNTESEALKGLSGAEKPPNIIFIMLDDLDYFDLPAYGNTEVQTPEIDSMVAGGMRLTNYYVNGPLCPPTRNSLMTGNYPSRHGIKRTPPESYKGIPAASLVLPQVLQGYGYTTAHVGKWHLGHRHDEYLPSNKGYDTSLVGVGFTGRVQPNYSNPHFLLNETTDVFPNKHATEALTDFALDFIDQNRAKPFFLNLWYFVPHLPLECPPGWELSCGDPSDPEYDAQVYRAMIANADQQIGRVFDKVTELGLDDNTFIVVTSDNGGVANATQAEPPPGQHLKGSKTEVLERGIKVPFIAWAPGLVPAATINDSVVMSFDMFQTLEQLARPEDIVIRMPFDGASALPILTTSPVIHVNRDETLFWELNNRDNDNYTPPTGWYQNFAVRSGDWKLVMDKNHDWTAPRLFDLSVDPGETTNLASANPQIFNKLMDEYWDWRKKTGTVPYYVETSSGDVTFTRGSTETSFQFTGNGGYADLSETKLFDFGEADFSASMKIRVDQGGTLPVIVRKPGSWILSLTGNNKLKLRVVASAETGIGDPATVIVSNSRLIVGQAYDVAFTITGFRSDNSTIRMYVDGVLQAQQSDTIHAAEVVPDPIRVGNNNNTPPDRPFIGEIENLSFRLNVLTQEEVDALNQ